MLSQTMQEVNLLEPLPVDIIGIDGEVKATIDDGYREDESIGEWTVTVDGETIGYASDESAARRRYNEALRVRREHLVKEFYQ